MLAVTDYNRPNPSFGVQVKVGPTSEKIGQYLKKSGLKSNHVLIGGLATTGGAAAVSLANPDLIAAPDAAKYGILGGLTSTTGAMFASMRKRETNINKDNSDEQVQTTTKTVSPLVMLGLGSSIGIGIPFAMFPIVQRNTSAILEQQTEIKTQNAILNEQKAEIGQKNEMLDSLKVIVEQYEEMVNEINGPRRYVINTDDYGELALSKKGLMQYEKLCTMDKTKYLRKQWKEFAKAANAAGRDHNSRDVYLRRANEVANKITNSCDIDIEALINILQSCGEIPDEIFENTVSRQDKKH